ncbi:hypothetical protein CFP56_018613, partial [Quercus suber]
FFTFAEVAKVTSRIRKLLRVINCTLNNNNEKPQENQYENLPNFAYGASREQDQSLSMIVKRIAPTKPIINLIHHHHHYHLHLLSTNCTHPPQPSKPITTILPPNPDHLLRVCTILYLE